MKHTIEPLMHGLSRRTSQFLSIGLVLLLTSLTFIRVPFFDFVDWDDGLHVYANPYLRSFNIGEIGHFWQHPYEQLYVPVSYTVFGLLSLAARLTSVNMQITTSGALLNPHVFHGANVALHLLNTVLIFLLLRRLTRSDLPSLLGSLLFAVHPLQVESVAWVSELRGLLAAAFSLGAIHLYLGYADQKDTHQRRAHLSYAFSLLLSILAMLSKPSAAILGLMIAAFGYWAGRRSVKEAALDGLPFALIGAVIVKITTSVQPEYGGQAVSVLLRPIVASDALGFYLWKFFLPFGLTIDYGRRPTWLLTHWWSYFELIIPLLLVTFAVLRRRQPGIVFGLTIALIGLLPVLGLTPFAFQEKSTTADRYVYFPLLGAAIITAYGLSAISVSMRRQRVIVIAIWLGALCTLSYNQVLFWRGNDSLFKHAVAVDPGSSVAQDGLGRVYQRCGAFQAALTHGLLAIQLNPEDAEYHNNVGLDFYSLGEHLLADDQFRTAIAIMPNNADAHCDLGIVQLGDGSVGPGIAELETALRLDPSEYLAAENLGAYYAQKGDYPEAEEIFTEGVRYRPDYGPLWRYLGLTLCAENRWQDALVPLEKAVRINPSDAIANDVLSTCRHNISVSVSGG